MTATAWHLEARGPKRLIGMVHLGASPGTPNARESPDAVVSSAVTDAQTLAAAGFDAVILENMHDAPYVQGGLVGPEVVALMARSLCAVRAVVSLPVGVQILSGGNTQAVACAHACGGAFIRCENFVFAHVADEGLLERAEAGPLLRYRRAIGAGHVRVYCDIKKKHASHAITADIDLGGVAEAAAFFGADALVVTGTATGKPTSPADVRAVREACDLPVLVGSGVMPDSASGLLDHADALIVGSWIKRDGSWKNAVDPERARAMARAVQAV